MYSINMTKKHNSFRGVSIIYMQLCLLLINAMRLNGNLTKMSRNSMENILKNIIKGCNTFPM